MPHFLFTFKILSKRLHYFENPPLENQIHMLIRETGHIRIKTQKYF